MLLYSNLIRGEVHIIKCIKSVRGYFAESKTYEEYFTEGRTYQVVDMDRYIYAKPGNILVVTDNMDILHCIAHNTNRNWYEDDWFCNHFIVE